MKTFPYKKGGFAYVVLENGKVEKRKVLSIHPTLNAVRLEGATNGILIRYTGQTPQEAMTKKMLQVQQSLAFGVKRMERNLEALKSALKVANKIDIKLRKSMDKNEGGRK